MERSRKVSAQLSNGVAFLMKKHKIAVIAGDAKLAGKGKLAVTKDGKTTDIHRQEHRAGDRRARPHACRAWSPTASWSGPIAKRWCRTAFPKSLLVVGSGAIGIEFASFYRTLGGDVTVVEVLDRVLPVEDEEISPSPPRPSPNRA